jgi:hypothetical protein
MGIDHNFVVALGTVGSSADYNLSISTADHQGFIGGYDSVSQYFNFNASSSGQGPGFCNDWWLGGPTRSTWPHDISLRMTSLRGADRDGIAFRLFSSLATGDGEAGPIELWGGVTGSSGFAQQDSVKNFTFSGIGKFYIHQTPDSAATATGGYLFRDAATGLVKIGPGTAGGGGGSGITDLNGLAGATQTFATGTSGTDFAISSSSTTHTFNIPSASASARGLVTTGSQTFAGAKTFNANTGIGAANSGPYSLYIERSNLDGGTTDLPGIKIKNTNASDPSGSGYNLAVLSMESGNGATWAQFGTSYGTGATAPWDESGFMITTRTDDPIIFWTGSTIGKRMVLNNSGVVNIPNLAGTGTRTVTTSSTGDLTAGATIGDLTGGAIKTNIHVVNDADYTVASTDYFIIYSNITTARTLTLPAASSNTNRMLIIKHGGSGSTAITLSTAIRENASTTTSSISQNFSYGIISDGTDWWIAWITNG